MTLERFCWLMVGLLIVLGITLAVLDGKEMRQQHCKPTDQTRQTTQLMSMPQGNGSVMLLPVLVEERLYVCDDFNRWR